MWAGFHRAVKETFQVQRNWRNAEAYGCVVASLILSGSRTWALERKKKISNYMDIRLSERNKLIFKTENGKVV